VVSSTKVSVKIGIFISGQMIKLEAFPRQMAFLTGHRHEVQSIAFRPRVSEHMKVSNGQKSTAFDQ
jgi:hypothetical protein